MISFLIDMFSVFDALLGAVSRTAFEFSGATKPRCWTKSRVLDATPKNAAKLARVAPPATKG